MKKTKKITSATKPFILILTIFVTIIGCITVNAQIPMNKPTYAFIGAMPNPLGVNQQTLLHIGITDPTPNIEHGWEGLTVTVTKPNGETETLGPYKTDATGGTGDVYVPDMVGTYKLQTHFPEQVMPEPGQRWLPAGTVMEASDSEILELVVQQDPLPSYPSTPLPSEYWTRPIDAQHYDWFKIGGNWQTIPPNRVAPYNDYAPESAHILWTKSIDTGGLVGGNLGYNAMECGDAYEGKFQESVIINGVLYYNRFGHSIGPQLGPQQGVIAVDLRTGKELWFKNNTKLDFGQTFYWDSYNYHGTFSYLWEVVGSTWNAYDTFTGEWVYTMTDVPATRNPLYGGFGVNTIFGSKNEIFAYTVNTEENWMSMWNSSRVVSNHGSWGRTMVSSEYNRVYPAELGIEWNVTIPANLPGVVNVVLEDRIIGSDVPEWTGVADNPITFWGLSTKAGQEGTLLFKETWQPPSGRLIMLWGTASLEDGVFVITSKEERALYGFSTDTGKQIWGPTETQPYLDIYTLGETRAVPRGLSIDDGKLYSVGMAGVLYCYDVNTAQLLWTYEAHDPFNEILWSNNWPMRIMFITDGKIYLSHDEHSPIDPKPRGAPYICLDAETGKELWSIAGAFRTTEWGGSSIIGDSIIATMDTYDQRIYAIGKGPSKTTVTAAPKVSALGNWVQIEGSVMDISSGTEEHALTTRFPNGVPAMADEYMSDWMLYVYKQLPRPTSAMGVEVKIEAYDPNGNYQNLGTATTDSYGNYGFKFKPEIEGQYMIMATFEGSKSYYASTTTTYLTVGPAQTPSTPIEPEEPIAPLISTEVAIIAAVAIIAVIGIVAYWVLRKRQ